MANEWSNDFGAYLLPVQYNRPLRWVISESERKLLMAVLMDAIQCYLANRKAKNRRRRIEFLEAQQWFERRGSEGQGLFAYETLCEALGVNPDALRKRLRAWPADDLRSRRAGRRRESAAPAEHAGGRNAGERRSVN